MFWNATNSCCDLFHSGVDDSAYIASIIADVKSTVAVDPKRIFVVGHSNGGFMAYRMACNHAGDIAAIVSLAGATYRPATSNSGRCPVAVTSEFALPGFRHSDHRVPGRPSETLTTSVLCARHRCAPVFFEYTGRLRHGYRVTLVEHRRSHRDEAPGACRRPGSPHPRSGRLHHRQRG